jgi:hypothetical protein
MKAWTRQTLGGSARPPLARDTPASFAPVASRYLAPAPIKYDVPDYLWIAKR